MSEQAPLSEQRPSVAEAQADPEAMRQRTAHQVGRLTSKLMNRAEGIRDLNDPEESVRPEIGLSGDSTKLVGFKGFKDGEGKRLIAVDVQGEETDGDERLETRSQVMAGEVARGVKVFSTQTEGLQNQEQDITAKVSSAIQYKHGGPGTARISDTRTESNSSGSNQDPENVSRHEYSLDAEDSRRLATDVIKEVKRGIDEAEELQQEREDDNLEVLLTK